MREDSVLHNPSETASVDFCPIFNEFGIHLEKSINPLEALRVTEWSPKKRRWPPP
jgi:hypothetical protein